MTGSTGAAHGAESDPRFTIFGLTPAELELPGVGVTYEVTSSRGTPPEQTRPFRDRALACMAASQFAKEQWQRRVWVTAHLLINDASWRSRTTDEFYSFFSDEPLHHRDRLEGTADGRPITHVVAICSGHGGPRDGVYHQTVVRDYTASHADALKRGRPWVRDNQMRTMSILPIAVSDASIDRDCVVASEHYVADRGRLRLYDSDRATIGGHPITSYLWVAGSTYGRADFATSTRDRQRRIARHLASRGVEAVLASPSPRVADGTDAVRYVRGSNGRSLRRTSGGGVA